MQCGPGGVYGGLCRGRACTHSLSECNRESGDENPQAPLLRDENAVFLFTEPAMDSYASCSRLSHSRLHAIEGLYLVVSIPRKPRTCCV
jgi:hypothetical protein